MFVCRECVSVRLFTVKTLLLPEVCTFDFMLHRSKLTMNWFFPAYRYDRWIKKLVAAPFIHRPLIPRVNLDPNNAGKMAVKYALKIISLKCIFKLMINIVQASPASKKVYVRKNAPIIIILAISSVPAWRIGLKADFTYKGRSHCSPAKTLCCCTFFVRFVFLVLIMFFPFGLFPFIHTAVPLQLRDIFVMMYF